MGSLPARRLIVIYDHVELSGHVFARRSSILWALLQQRQEVLYPSSAKADSAAMF